MKSVKYKKYYKSKYKFPTRVVTDQLLIGHKAAQKQVEQDLKRPLNKGFKVVTRGWNWCFMEPITEKENPE